MHLPPPGELGGGISFAEHTQRPAPPPAGEGRGCGAGAFPAQLINICYHRNLRVAL